jgi:hypothetical protein
MAAGSFIVDFAADIEERRVGIKKTPATRNQRRIDSTIHHLKNHLNFGFWNFFDHGKAHFSKSEPKAGRWKT